MHTAVVVHLITDSETAVTIHAHTHTSNLYTHRVVNTLAVVDTSTHTHLSVATVHRDKEADKSCWSQSWEPWGLSASFSCVTSRLTHTQIHTTHLMILYRLIFISCLYSFHNWHIMHLMKTLLLSQRNSKPAFALIGMKNDTITQL